MKFLFFSQSICASIFYNVFNGKWTKNDSQKYPGNHTFGDLFRTWSPLGSPWLPFGSLWLPFGSLLAAFGSLLAAFSSLFAPFGCLFAPLCSSRHPSGSFWGPPGAFGRPFGPSWGSNGSQNAAKAAQVVPKGSKNHLPDWLDFWEHSGIFVLSFLGSGGDSGFHLIGSHVGSNLWQFCIRKRRFYIKKSSDSNLDAPRIPFVMDVPHYPKRLWARGLAKLQRSLNIYIYIYLILYIMCVRVKRTRDALAY